MDLFDLNKEQQKAFNRLKRAYKDCEKLGVLFVNLYGDINAFNKDLIEDFGGEGMNPSGNNVMLTDAYEKFHYNANVVRSVDSYADDEISHVLGLTDKGLEVYESDS